LSGIAAQHAEDEYPRCANFGSALVRKMAFRYVPDSNNICDSRGAEFEGIGWVYGSKL